MEAVDSPVVNTLEVPADAPRITRARGMLYVLLLTHAEEVRERYEKVEPGDLSARAFEKWRPLLALASLFETHGVSGLEERMRALAAASMETSSAHASLEGLVQEACCSLARKGGGRHTASDVLAEARSLSPEVAKQLDVRSVGRALTRLGIMKTGRRYIVASTCCQYMAGAA